MDFKNIIADVMDRLDPDDIESLWYENDAGDKFYPDLSVNGYPDIPEGYIYQHFQDSALSHSINKTIQQDEVDACDHPIDFMKVDHGLIPGLEGETCEKCGGYRQRTIGGGEWPLWEAYGGKQIMVMNSGWPEDLVAAMSAEGVPLRKAILIAGNSCERCMNSLAHEFGLDWGYAELSDEWQECGTSCEYCEMLNTVPKVSGIQDQINLKAEYSQYNRKYFGGELPNIPLSWNRSKRAGGMASARIDRKTGELTPTGIKISTFLKMDEDRFKKILLHEMVHVWQYVHNFKDGHGRSFKKKAKEIGSKAGLIIPLTEDISGMEVSDDVKAKTYVAVIWKNSISLFLRNAFNTNRDTIEKYFERLATGMGETVKFYESADRDLMKYSPMRKLPRTGLKVYKLTPDLEGRIRSDGNLIGELKPSNESVAAKVVEKNFKKVGNQMVSYLEKRFGAKFNASTEARDGVAKAWINPMPGRAMLFIYAESPSNIEVSLKNDRFGSELVSKNFKKIPTVKDLSKLFDKAEKKVGEEAMVEAWASRKVAHSFDNLPNIKTGVSKMNNDDLANEVMKIANSLVADEYSDKRDRNVKYLEKKDKERKDEKKKKSLKKLNDKLLKRKKSEGWTEDEYQKHKKRKETQLSKGDASPDIIEDLAKPAIKKVKKVFDKIRGKGKSKPKGKDEFTKGEWNSYKKKHPDTKIRPKIVGSRIDTTDLANRVAYRFASSDNSPLQSMSIPISKRDGLVTASEMEEYCPDCAEKIASGEIEMTWGDLRELLEE